MKLADRIFACVLILGGVGHSIGSCLYYKTQPMTLLWALNPSALSFLIAAINLLRVQRPGDRPLAWICCAASLVPAVSAFAMGFLIGNLLDFRVLWHAICGVGLAAFSGEQALGREGRPEKVGLGAAACRYDQGERGNRRRTRVHGKHLHFGRRSQRRALRRAADRGAHRQLEAAGQVRNLRHGRRPHGRRAGAHRARRRDGGDGADRSPRHLPRIWPVPQAEAGHPRAQAQVAILIDFPEFHFVLARCSAPAGAFRWCIFVIPQFWAWKKERIRLVRKFVDKMLVIFPFEETFYREHGVEAEFVGHPLAEMPLPVISREEYARQASHMHQDQWNYIPPEAGPPGGTDRVDGKIESMNWTQEKSGLHCSRKSTMPSFAATSGLWSKPRSCARQ